MSNRFDDALNEVEAEMDVPAGPRERPQRQRKAEKVVPLSVSHGSADNFISAELALHLKRTVLPMTIRFHPQIATAMKRIVLENRLRGEKPDSIQDAMNEAAEAWIKASSK